MTIEISNKEDRQLVAGILIENGYTVRKVRVKAKGKSAAKTCLEVEKAKEAQE